MTTARRLARWILVLGAVSALGVASAAARDDSARPAASHHVLAHSAKTKKLKAGGLFLGGVTSAGWPVVVEVTRSLKSIKRTVMAIRTQCTSGQSFIDHDAYLAMKIAKSGRFSASFGPEDNGSPSPGITETAQGSIAGKFNKARTKVSGTWQLMFIDKNAAGAVTDTCDSGAVAWSAQQ
jgi:hypothetical protein